LHWIQIDCDTCEPQAHWIGLREKLQETTIIIGKSMVSGRFSLKPIHWQSSSARDEEDHPVSFPWLLHLGGQVPGEGSQRWCDGAHCSEFLCMSCIEKCQTSHHQIWDTRPWRSRAEYFSIYEKSGSRSFFKGTIIRPLEAPHLRMHWFPSNSLFVWTMVTLLYISLLHSVATFEQIHRDLC
jgi:hypothetical protein